jgi:hypothetical protein
MSLRQAWGITRETAMVSSGVPAFSFWFDGIRAESKSRCESRASRSISDSLLKTPRPNHSAIGFRRLVLELSSFVPPHDSP